MEGNAEGTTNAAFNTFENFHCQDDSTGFNHTNSEFSKISWTGMNAMMNYFVWTLPLPMLGLLYPMCVIVLVEVWAGVDSGVEASGNSGVGGVVEGYYVGIFVWRKRSMWWKGGSPSEGVTEKTNMFDL